MTGTLVASLLALAWLYAALRFRRAPRWQGRTRILSGHAVHDIGPAQLRDRFNPSAAGSFPTRGSSSPAVKDALSRLPLQSAPAADEISRSAA